MLFRSDRKSTRLNSSHTIISYAVFCLKKKNTRALEPHCNLASPVLLQTRQTPVRYLRGVTRRSVRRAEVRSRVLLCALFFFLKERAPPELPPLPHPGGLPI